MWTDAISGLTDLLTALAAFLAALTGVWLGLRKLTSGKKDDEPKVESGVAIPAAFDYEREWRYERERNNRLVERSDRLETKVTTLEALVLKYEALLAKHGIHF